MSVTTQDITSTLESEAPSAWAEEWDRVGLLAGDAAREVTGVFVSLDQTIASVAAAAAAGVNVLVTHHPAFREPPARVVAGGGAAGVVFAAVDAGIALIAAHTNLDRHPGAAEALPAALGLAVIEPLESGDEPCSSVAVYCPADAADAIASAMTDAGAGRVGRYAGCAFVTRGEGRFTPLAGAEPAAGAGAADTRVAEVRLETVCPRASVAAVSEAARHAHPYEEPLVVVTPSALSRGSARMGRVCEAPTDATVSGIAGLVARRLEVSPRVWGEGSKTVGRVAVAAGSAASMVPHALRAGADVLVCGELRYHESLEAVAAGLAVVEAGHDATEWPLVPVLADLVRRTPGLASDSVIVDDPVVRWRVERMED